MPKRYTYTFMIKLWDDFNDKAISFYKIKRFFFDSPALIFEDNNAISRATREIDDCYILVYYAKWLPFETMLLVAKEIHATFYCDVTLIMHNDDNQFKAEYLTHKEQLESDE